MKKLPIYLFLIALIFFVNNVSSQNREDNKPLNRILFILDCSQSMMSNWETGRKMDIAKKILTQMVDSLDRIENVEMALRLYGHQFPVPPQNCNDTKLEVPFEKNNARKIKQKLLYIIPKGTTPIAHSLELSANDFPKCENCKNVIILITDGIEACDGDPCAVSRDLQKKGIVLKPFVIGIGIDPEFKKTFQCVGRYYDASNEEKFKEVLNVVISQALNSTTAQVNLMDVYGNPTETNVNMTFYDDFSGKMRYNYVHTINNRGNPDTLLLDPLSDYNLVVQSIPPVELDSIHITPGIHNIIAVDAPQGYLFLKKPNTNFYNDLKFIVRKAGEMKTLNVQQINLKGKYLIGKYDIEVLSLPRININDVEVKQSYTTKMQIPEPGIVTISLESPGFASIYIEKENRLNWVCNLKENVVQESVRLQPGRYRFVYRARNAKQALYTINKKFKITSGASIRLKCY